MILTVTQNVNKINVTVTQSNTVIQLQPVLNNTGIGAGGGAVDSVNGQTGVVILTADNISETASRFWLTSILKNAYDSTVTWISINGLNLINHLSNTSNPHNVTAAQLGVPSGSGTSTGINTGDNATNTQYSGLAASKEDTSNKSTLTTDSTSTIKFPVWSAIVSYFDITRIKSILGISTLSGSNTGDETTTTIQTKRPLKTINGSTIEGSGDLTISGGSLDKTIISYVAPSISYFTGVATVETELIKFKIPAGTVDVSGHFDFSKIQILTQDLTGTQTYVYFRISTTGVFNTSLPYIIRANLQVLPGEQLSGYDRMFSLVNGKLVGIVNTSFQLTDIGIRSATSQTTFDRTIDNWIHVSSYLDNASNKIMLLGLKIDK